MDWICFFSTENWETYRDTTQFNLGDMIYIEAFVYQFYHVPLRVFVDNCVATTTSDPNSSPNYAFIDNHGWARNFCSCCFLSVLRFTTVFYICVVLMCYDVVIWQGRWKYEVMGFMFITVIYEIM